MEDGGVLRKKRDDMTRALCCRSQPFTHFTQVWCDPSAIRPVRARGGLLAHRAGPPAEERARECQFVELA